MVDFDVGWNGRGLRKKSWNQDGKICHFWVESRLGTGTKQGWYRYHLCRTKMVLVPRQSGTRTTHHNSFGTGTDLSGIGTDPSGTGTTASCSHDFWYSYIVKLQFIHRGYRNPNK